MEIRIATQEDLGSVAEIHYHATQAGYRDFIPPELLQNVNIEGRLPLWRKRFAEEHVIVIAREDGRDLGFAYLIDSPEFLHRKQDIAELSHIFVLPQFWNRGIGRALCDKLCEHVSQQGGESICLWTFSANTQARQTYERWEFALDGATRDYEYEGRKFPQVRFVKYLTPLQVGIQGQEGSACEEAAETFFKDQRCVFQFLTNAEDTLSALDAGLVDQAVLALESPCGTPVSETMEALRLYPRVRQVGELKTEVRHCLLVVPGTKPQAIKKIASHPIPLEKHRDYLGERFPGYQSVALSDPGIAARDLAKGSLSADTAVLALPKAAERYGLEILEKTLPANENYKTRFVVFET